MNSSNLVVKTLIWQGKLLIILSDRVLDDFSTLHNSVEKRKILSHWKFFREISYLVNNFFSKNIAFTKFLPEKSESKFP